MAKNRALTLKKAHQRREKIQSALLDKADFLYIKDIADLCAMQTVDISNDLKEMSRVGLLSKKEDKTAHPKRLMYKLKPVAAARLVKESKVALRQNAASVASVAEKPAAKPAAKTVSKNGKSAVSKAAPAPVAKAPALRQSSATAKKAAPAKPETAPVAKKPTAKAAKAAAPVATTKTAKVGRVAKLEKAAKPAKAAKTPKPAPASKAVKATPAAVNPKAEAPAKKTAAAKKSAPVAPVATTPAPRKRAPSGATQGQILAELAKGQALSIDVLCQRLNKQTANMYKMVGSLHAQGQIQKHKSAGRGFVYSLTGAAAPAPVSSPKPASKAKAASTASEAELLDNLIDKLAGAAKGFLRRLISN